MVVVANNDLGVTVGRDPIMCWGDPSGETSVDPGIGGYSDVDQMSLKFLGSRWNLVAGSSCYNEWSTTNVNGDILFNVPVTPAAIDGGAGTAVATTLQAPMVVGANCMFWRGKA
jgi:hypothetical protein